MGDATMRFTGPVLPHHPAVTAPRLPTPDIGIFWDTTGVLCDVHSTFPSRLLHFAHNLGNVLQASAFHDRTGHSLNPKYPHAPTDLFKNSGFQVFDCAEKADKPDKKILVKTMSFAIDQRPRSERPFVSIIVISVDNAVFRMLDFLHKHKYAIILITLSHKANLISRVETECIGSIKPIIICVDRPSILGPPASSYTFTSPSSDIRVIKPLPASRLAPAFLPPPPPSTLDNFLEPFSSILSVFDGERKRGVTELETEDIQSAATQKTTWESEK